MAGSANAAQRAKNAANECTAGASLPMHCLLDVRSLRRRLETS